ncbi:MAG: N-acetylmuramoyl-L-alanine amidase [Gemmatimonadetes bacterium]|nr:N-acetylmuramoyl-L-alanine amidase [Gemmatimonadota bacterium]
MVGRSSRCYPFSHAVIFRAARPGDSRMDLLDVLRQAAVDVHEVEGWRSRTREGEFNPIGIMNHHTACAEHGNAPSLKVCTTGRPAAHGEPALPGPLCHILLGRDGTAYLIAGDRARCNHAGKGSSVVLEEVRQGIAPPANASARGLADDTDGNTYFYGIEVENDGVGEAYSQQQIEALIRINAAICRWKGWTESQIIHHREWTRRKSDMSWKGDLRGEVGALLSPPPTADGVI